MPSSSSSGQPGDAKVKASPPNPSCAFDLLPSTHRNADLELVALVVVVHAAADSDNVGVVGREGTVGIGQ